MTQNSRKIPTVTVSQVNRLVSTKIRDDKRFLFMSVKGEISDFSRNEKSGHIYFTLCDESSKLKAVMWSSNAEELDFLPKNGENVVCSGSLTVYEAGGVYQLNTVTIDKAGDGEHSKDLAELTKRLKAEGLFDRKRQIPEFPKKIAVITSPDGAVLHDIKSTAELRCPVVKLLVIPTAVQGADSANSIVKAFAYAQKTDADTIIFGRGGGASDDLNAFNDEAVARAIFASRIPTISAVGHETNITIADFTADLRAATPTAAAMLATPDLKEFFNKCLYEYDRIKARVHSKINSAEANLNEKSRLINALSPQNRIAEKARKVDELHRNITRSMQQKLMFSEALLGKSVEVIEAVSPMRVLRRGYSITQKDGKAVLSSSELTAGDTVEIRFESGSAAAEIKEIRK